MNTLTFTRVVTLKTRALYLLGLLILLLFVKLSLLLISSDLCQLIHSINKSKTRLIVGVKEAIVILMKWGSIITSAILSNQVHRFHTFEGEVKPMFVSVLSEMTVKGESFEKWTFP